MSQENHTTAEWKMQGKNIEVILLLGNAAPVLRQAHARIPKCFFEHNFTGLSVQQKTVRHTADCPEFSVACEATF